MCTSSTVACCKLKYGHPTGGKLFPKYSTGATKQSLAHWLSNPAGTQMDLVAMVASEEDRAHSQQAQQMHEAPARHTQVRLTAVQDTV